MYIDIIIAISAIVFVCAVVVKNIIDKKQGKSSCCCDCSHCTKRCKQKESNDNK